MKNMVRFLLITGITVSMILLNACVKDENKDSYGLSKVVTYPVFSLTNGDFVVEIAHSGSWTDPGVAAYAGDVKVDVVSKGSVDPSKPGLYLINYTAFDESGLFSVSAERKVLIVSAPLTGNYTGRFALEHATRTGTIDVISMGGATLGWYRASDCWWQSSRIPVEFVDFGTELKVIPGNSPYGPFDGTVTFNEETGTLTFALSISEGINAGVAWTTIWNKQ